MNKFILCSIDDELKTEYKNLKLWTTSIGKISLYPNLINIFDINLKKLKNKNEIDDELLKYMVDNNNKLMKNKILIYTNNINEYKFMSLMNEIIKSMNINDRRNLFKNNCEKFYELINENEILNKCIIENLNENENENVIEDSNMI
jgi:hypothetical protein